MSVTFDTLQYTKGAEAVGIKREHAEYQAQQINKIIHDELVTKEHLSQEIINLEHRLIIKLGSITIGCAGLVIAILSFIIKH